MELTIKASAPSASGNYTPATVTVSVEVSIDGANMRVGAPDGTVSEIPQPSMRGTVTMYRGADGLLASPVDSPASAWVSAELITRLMDASPTESEYLSAIAQLEAAAIAAIEDQDERDASS